jgi:HAD superfamily hydrolase (TIGR01509 family)
MSGEQDTYLAVLFDMDGVLTDTAGFVSGFWRQIASEHCIMLSDDDLAAHVYGRTAEDTLDALFPLLDSAARQAVHVRQAAYEVALAYVDMGGAATLLHDLNRSGIPVVVVTSSSVSKVERVLTDLGIAELLTACVTAADISRGKPDPEPYLAGASKAGAPPARCVAFEDAVDGVRSAVAAGTTCIGIGDAPVKPLLMAAGARAVIPDLTAVRVVEVAKMSSMRGLRLRIDEQLSLPFDAREASRGKAASTSATDSLF